MKWTLIFLCTISCLLPLHSFANDAVLKQFYQSRKSDVQIQGVGKVIAVLADDNEGAKQQKFIIKRGSGQTLLVAHIIDLAPRLNNLQQGGTVQFYGEYEWNSRDGVMHWTHKDPAGKHIDGWLKHNGKTYW